MTNLFKIFAVISYILILGALILRVTGRSFDVCYIPVKSSSLFILANTSLLLAILFKK